MTIKQHRVPKTKGIVCKSPSSRKPWAECWLAVACSCKRTTTFVAGDLYARWKRSILQDSSAHQSGVRKRSISSADGHEDDGADSKRAGALGQHMRGHVAATGTALESRCGQIAADITVTTKEILCISLPHRSVHSATESTSGEVTTSCSHVWFGDFLRRAAQPHPRHAATGTVARAGLTVPTCFLLRWMVSA
jgi:hypothetical protein